MKMVQTAAPSTSLVGKPFEWTLSEVSLELYGRPKINLQVGKIHARFFMLMIRNKWMLFVDPDDWLRLSRPFRQLEHKYSKACNVIFPWIHYNVSSVDPRKISLQSAVVSSNQARGAATKIMVRTKHALSVSIHSTDTCIHGKRVYARRKDAHVAHLRFPKPGDLRASQRG